MAEAAAPEPKLVEPNTVDAAAVDMVVENTELESVPCGESEANGESNQKRAREEDEKEGVSKKQKVDEKEEEKKSPGPVKLGFKIFSSSLELFDYFYSFLHAWPPSLNVNKYEHMMLLELVKNGHQEPDTKIGGGIVAFQVRKHPMWKSRCFFLIREDESVDDFSFRKCVNHILPLPEAMQPKSDANRALGGGAKHRGGKGGGGKRGVPSCKWRF